MGNTFNILKIPRTFERTESKVHIQLFLYYDLAFEKNPIQPWTTSGINLHYTLFVASYQSEAARGNINTLRFALCELQYWLWATNTRMSFSTFSLYQASHCTDTLSCNFDEMFPIDFLGSSLSSPNSFLYSGIFIFVHFLHFAMRWPQSF